MQAAGELPRDMAVGAPDPSPAGRALRILMVTPRFLPEMGGIETHVNEVGRRLVEAGHQVSVLTTDRSGERPVSEAMSGMRIQRVRAYPRGGDYYLAPALWRAMMAAEADIIHVQGYHTLVPPLAMLAALRKRVPFVITFHSGGHSSALRNMVRGLQWALLAPLVRRAARWIAVSRYEADHFSARMALPREAVCVVPNGAGMPAETGPPAARPAAPLVVSIGRLERYKGHHRAIQALPFLRQQHPGACLRVLGEGPYRAELESLTARLGLGDAVTLGAVPPGERARLAAVLRSASLVVLLSDYEAHPVAVLEALALGCPVLTTDTSGFREMAEQGMVRAIPPSATPEEVARAMIAAMAGERRAATLALPSWEDCAGRLEAVYRAACRAVAT